MYVLKSSFQFVDYVLPLEYENIDIANVKNKVLGITLGSQPKFFFVNYHLCKKYIYLLIYLFNYLKNTNVQTYHSKQYLIRQVSKQWSKRKRPKGSIMEESNE
jgi:hypothetical protein